MDEKVSGLKGLAAADAPIEVQPALFEAPLRAPAERRGGPGRPKGVPNRTTREARDYLVGKYGYPVEGMTAIACEVLGPGLDGLGERLARLSRELGCDRYQAALFARGCAEAAAGYLMPKMPAMPADDGAPPYILAIEGFGKLVMGAAPASAAPASDHPSAVDEVAAVIQHFQGVSAAAAGDVGRAVSDVGSKSLIGHDNAG